jgi:guanylate kinase
MDYPGNLFIVAAPSGAGKSSLVKALRELDHRVQPSVSHTTRAPRGQEKNGREYHFVDNFEFELAGRSWSGPRCTGTDQAHPNKQLRPILRLATM